MPKKITKKPKAVSVDELLSLIPESLHEQLIATYQADKWVQKLKSYSLFKLLLYSLLNSEQLSLRTIADSYKTPWYQAFDDHAFGETAHTSIRDRLTRVKAEYFEGIYDYLCQQVQQHYASQELNRYYIKRYDSTMIAVFSHLLEGMKVGDTSRNKTQVKLTTEYGGEFSIRMQFFKDQQWLSEEHALKEAIESSSHGPDDIIVFDRGISDRNTLGSFHNQLIQFVTRLNENVRYDVIDSHDNAERFSDAHFQFVQDSIIYLYGSGRQRHPTEFRLVEMIRLSDNTHFFFLTNIKSLTAKEIADIYRCRWDIEVLFRFMKQEMNLTHFLCHNTNAIQVMLYCTLIAAMLILVYRKMNQIRSYKMAKIRFFRELQASILLELLESEETLKWFKKNLKTLLKKE